MQEIYSEFYKVLLVDTNREIKGLIRKGDSKTACRFDGLLNERVHFLELPFYETGSVKRILLGLKI